MISILFRGVDLLSSCLDRLARGVVVLLVASMVYEVVARYVFGRPTVWAFDISYMATGVLFILGAGHAVRGDAHIRIDVLSSRLSDRVCDWADGLVYTLALFPFFTALAVIATGQAGHALMTGEVETVSPWAPVMWPFYGALALGLWGLALQVLVEGLRALGRASGIAPQPPGRDSGVAPQQGV